MRNFKGDLLWWNSKRSLNKLMKTGNINLLTECLSNIMMKSLSWDNFTEPCWRMMMHIFFQDTVNRMTNFIWLCCTKIINVVFIPSDGNLDGKCFLIMSHGWSILRKTNKIWARILSTILIMKKLEISIKKWELSQFLTMVSSSKSNLQLVVW